MRQAGFFDVENWLWELSTKGDDPERIAALADFALFRPDLELAVLRPDGTKGSRPEFDNVVMLKCRRCTGYVSVRQRPWALSVGIGLYVAASGPR